MGNGESLIPSVGIVLACRRDISGSQTGLQLAPVGGQLVSDFLKKVFVDVGRNFSDFQSLLFGEFDPEPIAYRNLMLMLFKQLGT